MIDVKVWDTENKYFESYKDYRPSVPDTQKLKENLWFLQSQYLWYLTISIDYGHRYLPW